MKIIDCVPHWNGLYFNFTLYWTVPEFVAYGSGIFNSFVVIAEEKIIKRFIDRRNVLKTPNQTLYSYTWQNLRPLESNRKYQFRVNVRCSLCTCKCSLSPPSVLWSRKPFMLPVMYCNVHIVHIVCCCTLHVRVYDLHVITE